MKLLKYIATTFTLMAVLATPFASHAFDPFAAGDLIKEPGAATVYYYGYDGKRHAFPNETTYFSWYKNFSRVKTISKSTLSSLPLGRNIVVRPGSYLVKFKNSPKVYAVEPLGGLRHILNASLARDLYGPAWGHKVKELPEYLFNDYKVRDVLAKAEHPTGTVFRYNGSNDYYLMTNRYARKIASVAKWENYRFNDFFVAQVDRTKREYQLGSEINYYKASLADTAQTLVEEEINDYLYYVKFDSSSVIQPRVQGNGTGLTGYYYSNPNLTGASTRRVDPQINFNWGEDRPMSGLTHDFSVRWTGRIEIPASGNVDFFMRSDDGVRLYIDNRLVIDNWIDQEANWASGSINLNKGTYPIKIEYYDSMYGAVIEFAWRDQNTLVPQQYLYTQ
jgi:hypothetical protein